MTYCLPLVLLAVHLFFATHKLRYAVLAALFSAAQLYSSMYLAVLFMWQALGVSALLTLLVRPPLRRLVIPGAISVALALALAFPLVRTYEAARLDERSVDELALYSAEVSDYLRAHPRSAFWGNRTLPGPPPAERALFPGLMALALTIIGLTRRLGRTRVVYLGALLIAFEISRGANGFVYPYLYEWLSFMRGMRAPARAGFLVGLALAVLWPGSGFSVLSPAVPVRLHSPSWRAHARARRRLAADDRAPARLAHSAVHLPIRHTHRGARRVSDGAEPQARFMTDTPHMYLLDLARRSTHQWLQRPWPARPSRVPGRDAGVSGCVDDRAPRERAATTHVTVNCFFYERCRRLLQRIRRTRDLRLVSDRVWQGRPVLLYELRPNVDLSTVKSGPGQTDRMAESVETAPRWTVGQPGARGLPRLRHHPPRRRLRDRHWRRHAVGSQTGTSAVRGARGARAPSARSIERHRRPRRGAGSWNRTYDPLADEPPRVLAGFAMVGARACSGGLLRVCALVLLWSQISRLDAHSRHRRSALFGLACVVGLPPAARRSAGSVRRQHLSSAAADAHLLRLDAPSGADGDAVARGGSPSGRRHEHHPRAQLRGFGVHDVSAGRPAHRIVVVRLHFRPDLRVLSLRFDHYIHFELLMTYCLPLVLLAGASLLRHPENSVRRARRGLRGRPAVLVDVPGAAAHVAGARHVGGDGRALPSSTPPARRAGGHRGDVGLRAGLAARQNVFIRRAGGTPDDGARLSTAPKRATTCDLTASSALWGAGSEASGERALFPGVMAIALTLVGLTRRLGRLRVVYLGGAPDGIRDFPGRERPHLPVPVRMAGVHARDARAGAGGISVRSRPRRAVGIRRPAASGRSIPGGLVHHRRSS